MKHPHRPDDLRDELGIARRRLLEALASRVASSVEPDFTSMTRSTHQPTEARILMMKIVFVDLDERVVISRRGLPLRALGPGRHFLWGFGLSERAWLTTPL